MRNSTLSHGNVNNAMNKVSRKGGKYLAFVIFLLSLTLGAMANPVDEERARQVATTFLNNNSARSVDLTNVSSVVGFSNVYVFSTEKSFVLVAADDCVQPILGYSLTGRFDFENMPDNKRAWIQGYSDEIRYAVDNQLRASSEVAQQWQDLAEGNPNAGKAITVVAPLIQTQWDQDSPYNMLCPGGSVTGCVATAMAQIMKYWNYPEHGIGSHTYIHATYGELSADFQSTTYDWTHMTNTYNSSSTYTQKMAVATLMYHCGVSVDMDYSPISSGAGSAIVAEALKDYFNYSSEVVFHNRSEYSDNVWINMLKADLNLNRPIWYSGLSTDGGHAFVFDGYNNSNYFHVNWGWGGYFDEYYVINNLNPGPGGIGSGSYGIYNEEQGAVFGIRPSECTANAPSNLTYSQNGRNVTLSWSTASGASSYKVYCNNNNIGNVSSTSYSDTAPFGNSVYYVRSVDSQGRLSLSSNAVTISVEYLTPIVDDLAATVSDNNVNLTWTAPDWCYPATPTATMTYGNGEYTGSAMGFNNGTTCMYWGHRYSTSTLSNYSNMKVYKVSFYANETGSYKVYVYKGTTSGRPQTLLRQQSFSVGSIGWCDIDLSTPIQIDASNDLWVFIYDPEARNFPAAFCSYSGNEGNYYSTNPTSGIYTWANSAFLIRTFVADATYTYNIYRNNSCIANNVSSTSYSDNNLPSGMYNYYVKTNYYAGETEASNQVSVQIGTTYNISALANPTEGGTISGAGNYAEGQTCTLSAMANEGYTFMYWTENGEVVSTEATYSFIVTGDRNLVANFVEDSVITIGDGGEATNQYLPSFSYYNYSLSQQIYTVDEIGTDGFINSIAFFNGGTEKTRSYNVYMVHTDKNNFDSTIDWIAVTEADRVFSGTITMTANAWTTFWFDTPFAYNGVSNLALIVDDNSGDWTDWPHMACRVFNAQGNQAIRVYSDETNYDPYSPSGYDGTLHSVKNQIKLGIIPYELTVHDGTTTNGYVPVHGLYADAYLKSEFIMPASELTQMAGFSINRMKFYASQANVSWGDASFQVFMKEVDDTSINSYSGLEDATVVYEGSLNISDGVMDVVFTVPYQYGGGNLLIGFYETTTGSWVSSYWYGEAVEGASVQGKSFNSLENVDCNQRDFLPKTTFYYQVPDSYQQSFALASGCNWFSTYLDITLDELKETLVEALPTTSITIKSRTQNTAYNPNTNRWMGTLDAFNVTQMYMIYVSTDCEITLTGTPINPAEHPVTISNGSNWIAFPLAENMSVSDAFAGFAVNGDKVKSRNNNSQYQGGSWRGQLTTLVPGQGYMYISNTQGDRTFTFPTSAK